MRSAGQDDSRGGRCIRSRATCTHGVLRQLGLCSNGASQEQSHPERTCGIYWQRSSRWERAMTGRLSPRGTTIAGLALALTACATPARMHSEAQLNDVALGCGLALGELIQDEEQKKLLLLIRSDPSPSQRI